MSTIDLKQISFHDSGLLDLSQTGSTITLALENVIVGDVQKDVQVEIDGVRSIVRNDEIVSCLKMEKESGEILTLRKEEKHISLVIQWDDFDARTHEVIAYTLDGPEINLRAVPTEADKP